MDRNTGNRELGYFESRVVRAYPHVQAYAFINIALLVATAGALVLLSRDYGRAVKIVSIVAAAVLAPTLVATFICTTFSGFVSVVVLDSEGASQKRWGKLVEWRWDEIYDIDCNTHCPWIMRSQPFYPKFRLRCESHDKVLVFTWNKDVDKYFTTLCTNENINEKFTALLSACDYDYPGRFDNNNITPNEEAERNKAASIRIFRINSFIIIGLAVVVLILLLASDIPAWILIIVFFGGIVAELIVNFIIYLVTKKKK